jgi:hypothetical protein
MRVVTTAVGPSGATPSPGLRPVAVALRAVSPHERGWFHRLGWVSSDEFSLRYSDLVTGSYDCVDRIVLNAFFPLGHNPGGFRTWWRRLHRAPSSLPRCMPSPVAITAATPSARAGYDLRKLRGNTSSTNPAEPAATTSRPWLRAPSPPCSPSRDQVIAPILAAVRSPAHGTQTRALDPVDRDYERIRIDMHTLFNDLAIETPLAA